MPSPFDDLLKEFDDPLNDSPDKPMQDPLRDENLELLMKLSKKIEAVAATLDPSGPKHPLYQQIIPEEARPRLKDVIGGLMDIQGDLHEIEKNLLEESPTKDSERAMPPASSMPESHEDAPAKDLPFVSPTEEKSSSVERAPLNPLPIDTPKEPVKESPAPLPSLTQPSPSPEHLALEKEKEDFEAYKTTWEQVFAQDPAQRLAHPEVAAYYTQMQTYFQEKEAYLKQISNP